MTDPTFDRPLVTFAVFAYNQEAFIREAIEGAFSQTYEPLEIILSDDCSGDRTFEIMQEMAAAYEGPHRVKVRRNTFNLGTALHVEHAFALSEGQLFVVAAGDDISTENRVSALVNAWNSAGKPEGALHSGYSVFRDCQTIKTLPAKHYRYSQNVLQGFALGYWLPAAAPTCAYTRGVFEHFGPLIGGSIIEDAPLQFRVGLLGQFISCDLPLVRIRSHDNNSGTGYHIGQPARWNRFIQSKTIAFRTMQRDLAGWDGEIDQRLRSKIERKILAVMRSAPGLLLPESYHAQFFERIRFAFRASSAPAVARTTALRLDYVLGLFGFVFHQHLKTNLRAVKAGLGM